VRSFKKYVQLVYFVNSLKLFFQKTRKINKMLRRVISQSTRAATQAQSSSMQQGYDKKVLDHFEKPRNVGKLDAKKKNVGTES